MHIISIIILLLSSVNVCQCDHDNYNDNDLYLNKVFFLYYWRVRIRSGVTY